MKQTIGKKLAKLTSLVLAIALGLSIIPIHHAEATETQNTVTVNQTVAHQVQKQYLADSNGYFVQKASVDQVNLPFSPELYYGRSLLSEGGQQAWDYVVKELLAFNPAKGYKRYTKLNDGHGQLIVHLQEAGIIAPASDIKHFNKYLIDSEPRMFHIRNWAQEYDTDSNGNVTTVTFYIAPAWTEDNVYQDKLIQMETLASHILSVIDTRMTDPQKVAALYNKYNANMSYQWFNSLDRSSMVGALTYGKAICGGYTYGFQYLSMRAGLPTLYVTGDTSRGYHAWNYVKVEDAWYFVDTTWGTNRWLLRGDSSLSTHAPRKSFSVMPVLSETDMNLDETVFSVEKYNETVASETIRMTISAVESVLNNHVDKLSQIEQIYMFEPTTWVFVANEVEEAISAEIQEAVKGKFTGVLSVDISNVEKYTTVEELMESGLRIGFQASDDTTYYYYQLGVIEVYE